MANPSQHTDTRVEVLETRVGGIEKTLGIVLSKIDAIAAAFGAQPKHTSIGDQLRIIGATVFVVSSVFAGMTWWLNANLAPDRQRLESVWQQTADLAVMRYRIEQLEKTSEHVVAKNP